MISGGGIYTHFMPDMKKLKKQLLSNSESKCTHEQMKDWDVMKSRDAKRQT